jgi:hypothetical protein
MGDPGPPHASLCASIHSMTVLELRPLICANSPPEPLMSTKPVSNRSIHTFTPVSVWIS